MATESIPKLLFIDQNTEELIDNRFRRKQILHEDQNKQVIKQYQYKFYTQIKLTSDYVINDEDDTSNTSIFNAVYCSNLGKLFYNSKKGIVAFGMTQLGTIVKAGMFVTPTMIQQRGSLFLSPKQTRLLILNQNWVHIVSLQENISNVVSVNNIYNSTNACWENEQTLYFWSFQKNVYSFDIKAGQFKQVKGVNACTGMSRISSSKTLILQGVSLHSVKNGRINKSFSLQEKNKDEPLFQYMCLIGLAKLNNLEHQNAKQDDVYVLVGVYYTAYDEGDDQPCHRYAFFMKGNIENVNSLSVRGSQLLSSVNYNDEEYYLAEDQKTKHPFSCIIEVQPNFAIILIQKTEFISLVDSTEAYQKISIFTTWPRHGFRIDKDELHNTFIKALTIMKNMFSFQQEEAEGDPISKLYCNQNYKGQFFRLFFSNKQADLTLQFPASAICFTDSYMIRKYAACTADCCEEERQQDILNFIKQRKVSRYIKPIISSLSLSDLRNQPKNIIEQKKQVMQQQKAKEKQQKMEQEKEQKNKQEKSSTQVQPNEQIRPKQQQRPKQQEKQKQQQKPKLQQKQKQQEKNQKTEDIKIENLAIKDKANQKQTSVFGKGFNLSDGITKPSSGFGSLFNTQGIAKATPFFGPIGDATPTGTLFGLSIKSGEGGAKLMNAGNISQITTNPFPTYKLELDQKSPFSLQKKGNFGTINSPFGTNSLPTTSFTNEKGGLNLPSFGKPIQTQQKQADTQKSKSFFTTPIAPLSNLFKQKQKQKQEIKKIEVPEIKKIEQPSKPVQPQDMRKLQQQKQKQLQINMQYFKQKIKSVGQKISLYQSDLHTTEIFNVKNAKKLVESWNQVFEVQSQKMFQEIQVAIKSVDKFQKSKKSRAVKINSIQDHKTNLKKRLQEVDKMVDTICYFTMFFEQTKSQNKKDIFSLSIKRPAFDSKTQQQKFISALTKRVNEIQKLSDSLKYKYQHELAKALKQNKKPEKMAKRKYKFDWDEQSVSDSDSQFLEEQAILKQFQQNKSKLKSNVHRADIKIQDIITSFEIHSQVLQIQENQSKPIFNFAPLQKATQKSQPTQKKQSFKQPAQSIQVQISPLAKPFDHKLEALVGLKNEDKKFIPPNLPKKQNKKQQSIKASQAADSAEEIDVPDTSTRTISKLPTAPVKKQTNEQKLPSFGGPMPAFGANMPVFGANDKKGLSQQQVGPKKQQKKAGQTQKNVEKKESGASLFTGIFGETKKDSTLSFNGPTPSIGSLFNKQKNIEQKSKEKKTESETKAPIFPSANTNFGFAGLGGQSINFGMSGFNLSENKQTKQGTKLFDSKSGASQPAAPPKEQKMNIPKDGKPIVAKEDKPISPKQESVFTVIPKNDTTSAAPTFVQPKISGNNSIEGGITNLFPAALNKSEIKQKGGQIFKNTEALQEKNTQQTQPVPQTQPSNKQQSAFPISSQSAFHTKVPSSSPSSNSHTATPVFSQGQSSQASPISPPEVSKNQSLKREQIKTQIQNQNQNFNQSQNNQNQNNQTGKTTTDFKNIGANQNNLFMKTNPSGLLSSNPENVFTRNKTEPQSQPFQTQQTHFPTAPQQTNAFGQTNAFQQHQSHASTSFGAGGNKFMNNDANSGPKSGGFNPQQMKNAFSSGQGSFKFGTGNTTNPFQNVASQGASWVTTANTNLGSQQTIGQGPQQNQGWASNQQQNQNQPWQTQNTGWNQSNQPFQQGSQSGLGSFQQFGIGQQNQGWAQQSNMNMFKQNTNMGPPTGINPSMMQARK